MKEIRPVVNAAEVFMAKLLDGLLESGDAEIREWAKALLTGESASGVIESDTKAGRKTEPAATLHGG
jgi:hypothetical protein